MSASSCQVREEVAEVAPLPNPAGREQASTLGLVLAFACIYFIWGSTFLAIRYAIETIPPFLMAGCRFLVAGAVLYACVWRGRERPKTAHWVNAFVLGGLLFLCGNGAVVWSEQRIPSGLAALLMATIPLWMVLLDALQRRQKPGWKILLGLCIGFAGVIILIGPGNVAGDSRPDIGAGIVSVFGAICWAAGSIYSRRVALPSSMFLASAMQMIGGGCLFVVAGLATGEGSQLAVHAISMRSLLCLAYLTFFGSLLAFSAYAWLLKVAAPGHVATYAYVNPVIAVTLGWLIGGEPVTIRLLLAAGVILFAVVWITMHAKKKTVQVRT